MILRFIVARTVLFVFLMVNGCANKSDDMFSREFVSRLSGQLDIVPPPPMITFVPVYLSIGSDTIHKTRFEMLKNVYKNIYYNKYKKFENFLVDILNQRLKFDCSISKTRIYSEQIIRIDETVGNIYLDSGIHGIINKFCSLERGKILLNRGLPIEITESISYYFFINGYLRYDDDIKPNTMFKKLAE